MSERLHANKKLGQHFLTNQTVIQKIISDGPRDSFHAIVEVGPGPGALTTPLTQCEYPLYVVEKDPRFCQLWQEKIGANHVWSGDALEIDLDGLLHGLPENQKPIWAVSNLPYNAGTPIAVRLMRHPDIIHLTLMFQREVAQKFLLSQDMNSIGALANLFFKINLVSHVAPGSFSPPPKVQSTVISLSRLTTPRYSLNMWEQLEDFFARLFAHRRKTVSNVLKPYYSKEAIALALERAGLSPLSRAESFNLEQVGILYDTLHSPS